MLLLSSRILAQTKKDCVIYLQKFLDCSKNFKLTQTKLMSERFDTVFESMSEASAIDYLNAKIIDLDNPGLKYIAATRLGACTSKESFNTLLEIARAPKENLYEKIARRKAIEALGRRKNTEAIPFLIDALKDDDELTVINAADSITRINTLLTDLQQHELLLALNGPDNQKRSVIQAFTRLNLSDPTRVITQLTSDGNPLVSGAAIAYSCRCQKDNSQLHSIIKQLHDENAGRRRAAVIDIGDAGVTSCLEALVKCPVSMPLKAKSAFQLFCDVDLYSIPLYQVELLEMLLIDDPRKLNLLPAWQVSIESDAIKVQLKHRDEGRQYAAIKALLCLDKKQQVVLINELHKNHGSDYGIHYFITSCIGLIGLKDSSNLIADSLFEESPQYAKSRIAAAWSCLKLSLIEHKEFISTLGYSTQWEPLKWTCKQVSRKLS